MTIRLAHISDLHVDERGRLQDIIDVLRAFVRQARDASVDLILVSGDWFERRSTPAERLAVADFLEEAMHVAPVFGVKGNHDVDLDLSLFPRLDLGGDGVVIKDRPTAMPGSAKVYWLGDHRRRGERGGNVKLGFLALPWFDKAQLVSQLDVSIDQEQTRQHAIVTVQELLTCLRTEASRLRNEGVIPILVGHVLVAGSEVSTGQTLIGMTVELAPGDLLDVGAAYVALGHIHKSQSFFDGRVAYAGSPHRCNFGESESKGWRLVILSDEGEFVSNEFVELPARPMKLVEHDATGPDGLRELHAQRLQNMDWRDIPRALVRFRYRIRAEDLHLVDERAIEAALLEAGAAEVKLEAVVEVEARARVPEIVTVQSTADKVDAYFRAKGIDIDADRRERLKTKLALLEGGSDAAA